jgi:transcriptional regulator GlxA family with amidase domain
MLQPVQRVVIVVFDRLQSLDATGPFEVLRAAGYRVELASPTGEPVRSESGLLLGVDRSLRSVRGPLDTLLVAGGHVGEAMHDRAMQRALVRLAPQSRRLASVCSGALILAEAGLLDGRRATTHWGACELLAREYPTITVEPDPIFVRDGNVWTSAGVTAGMDLALALVEEDQGRDAALDIARGLVMYVQRPGGQAQFSAALRTQRAVRQPLQDVQAWVAEHLDADLSVARLAEVAAMSPRHFSRAFAAETGMTPARYVAELRVEAARRLLESTTRPVEDIATTCGFGTAETLRRAFQRSLRVPPTDYRQRFNTEATT